MDLVANISNGFFCSTACKKAPTKTQDAQPFETARDALAAGFRPCRICTPLKTGIADPAWLVPLMSEVDQDPARRWQTIQWVHFQMGGIGPMFGQVGFFHKFAGKDYEDKRPLQRYVDEAKRLLGVIEQRLAGRQWIMDDEYTIADISMLGWVRNLIGFYGARELVARQLPPYMVPSRLIEVDRWPLNAHGKIDRSALRARLEEER